MLFWQILGVAFLVGANGFFVAAEFALVKVRAAELEERGRDGARRAPRLVRHMLGHLDAYLSACQLGITLASLGLGWAGEPLVARMIEPAFHAVGLPEEQVHYAAFPIAFFLITFLHLTLGEQAPKIAAIQRPTQASLIAAYPLAIFYTVFRPFIWLINVSSNGMLRLVGLSAVTSHDEAVTEEEVRMILAQAAAKGSLGPREQRIMMNVMDLEEKSARSCMVPRGQIVYLDVEATLEETLTKAADCGHSRLPLCRHDLRKILGILHVKDLFAALSRDGESLDLEALSREAMFLPESIKLDRLLRQFQQSRNHMAILVDEYGGVDGMITLENVLEEMVGPIQDEFDAETPLLVKQGEDRYEADGACPLRLLLRTLEMKTPAAVDVDTVGGLLAEQMGRIPETGETLTLGDYLFTVLEAGPRRVQRVLVERPPRS